MTMKITRTKQSNNYKYLLRRRSQTLKKKKRGGGGGEDVAPSGREGRERGCGGFREDMG